VSIFLLAVYGILSRKVGKDISPVLIVAYGLLFASVMTFPLMMMEHPWNNIVEADLKGWLSVLHLAMFGSVAAYFSQQIAIKQLGAGRSMAFMNLIPVFSVFLAVLILHEHVSILQIASIALIIFGVSINVRSGVKPEVKGTAVSPSRS
jgi:drug/metabolite transporter (DMT)-like permease